MKSQDGLLKLSMKLQKITKKEFNIDCCSFSVLREGIICKSRSDFKKHTGATNYYKSPNGVYVYTQGKTPVDLRKMETDLGDLFTKFAARIEQSEKL